VSTNSAACQREPIGLQGGDATGAAPGITDADAIDLLYRLVSTPSVSGEEHAAAVVACAWARDRGLDCLIDDVGNVVVQAGDPLAERLIVLLGHIDTYPGMPPVRIENGVLFGRGSVDAKGPLAAFIVAAGRAKLPPNVRVVVVGAVEEECATSRGARAIAARLRPDACIIGEPSGTTGVTLGYKGRLLVDASVCQPCSHSAGPGLSASDALIAWWNGVCSRIDELNAGHSGAFDAIQATIRALSTAQNGIHDQAEMTAGFRLPPWIGPERLSEVLRNVEGAPSLKFSGGEHAVLGDRSSGVVRALTQSIRASGATPTVRVKTGTSDMNVVAPVWHCPIAAFGPGDSSLDHTPGEHIHLDEFCAAIRILTNAVERLACELSATADSGRQPSATLGNEARGGPGLA